ncbi:MAG: CRISPR-associated protein Cas4 [Myxococcales bacterium]|nr:CRISPR-associated protein Cas4 [Myxococcales bacterium]
MDSNTPWIMLSALQAYRFCPRQCALIHNESIFDENLYTLRGKREHEHVHEEGLEVIGKTYLYRGLRLFHDKLFLYGVADLVEMTYEEKQVVKIFPVEYKSGRRKREEHDDIQLAAQALCLEEMFQIPVETGAIYHISSKKRREVSIDQPLRERLQETILAVRGLLKQQKTPLPVADARCRLCAQRDSCLPFAAERLVQRSTLSTSTSL